MLALLALWTAPAHANERHFTYVYDTLVLPRDIREIEPWVTFTPANVGGVRIDTRLEFELPVTDRLMTALYLNGKSTFQEAGLTSVSSEWKLQLANRALQPLGLALYGEVTAGPHEAELEGKLLLDREQGPFLLALNLVGEAEWAWEDTGADVESEFYGVLEALAAASWVPGGGLPSVGVEAVDAWVVSPEGGVERHRLSAGPTLGLARTGWWGAITWIPELLDGDPVAPVALDGQSVRILLGMDL